MVRSLDGGLFTSPVEKEMVVTGSLPRAGTLDPAVFLPLLETCSPAPARNTLTDVLKWTRGVYATDHLNTQ